MTTAALALVLDSPLQSWGHGSQFTHRTTAQYPTKSGVIGLIAAAMGIDKQASDEEERVRPLAALGFSVFRVPWSARGQKGDVLPVVALEDYHTVGGGYDEGTPRGKLSIPKKAERGGSFGTVVTHRRYLQQGRFVAVLEGDRPILEGIAKKLVNPVWGCWLGRKCCVPASPMLHHGDPASNVCDTLNEAVQMALNFMGCSLPPSSLDCEETASLPGCAKHVQADEPLSFGKRRYSHRAIQVKSNQSAI
jgi:CRISPR system Cascade subunit CasD